MSPEEEEEAVQAVQADVQAIVDIGLDAMREARDELGEVVTKMLKMTYDLPHSVGLGALASALVIYAHDTATEQISSDLIILAAIEMMERLSLAYRDDDDPDGGEAVPVGA